MEQFTPLGPSKAEHQELVEQMANKASKSWTFIAEQATASGNEKSVSFSQYSEILLMMVNSTNGTVYTTTVCPVDYASSHRVNVYYNDGSNLYFGRVENNKMTIGNASMPARLYGR